MISCKHGALLPMALKIAPRWSKEVGTLDFKKRSSKRSGNEAVQVEDQDVIFFSLLYLFSEVSFYRSYH